MSESSSDLYERAVEKGREVARASRYEGLNNDKLAELLPELSADEREALGKRIEDAIQSEVKNTLTRLQRKDEDTLTECPDCETSVTEMKWREEVKESGARLQYLCCPGCGGVYSA